MSDYPLYYTLNKNVKDTDLPVKQKNVLLKFVKMKTLTENQKKVIILLSSEHARFIDGHEFDPDYFELPYGIYEDSKGVHFDLDKMPNELKWILYKFSSMATH